MESLRAALVAIALLSAGPALAFNEEPAPVNKDGSPRFADPDEKAERARQDSTTTTTTTHGEFTMGTGFASGRRGGTYPATEFGQSMSAGSSSFSVERRRY